MACFALEDNVCVSGQGGIPWWIAPVCSVELKPEEPWFALKRHENLQA